MFAAHNQHLKAQIYCLEQFLQQNRIIKSLLRLAPKLRMPNWYLGAGCISQTVWNVQHGFDLIHGIEDYDLVYQDPSDTSYEGEDYYVRRGRELFKDIPGQVEIKNEARVHLWYERHFGYKIKPYESVEDAINTWPTTATCVAVKYDDKDRFVVYAPYGLNDLFGMIVRPNKFQIKKEIYEKKVERWVKIWHRLKIIPWDDERHGRKMVDSGHNVSHHHIESISVRLIREARGSLKGIDTTIEREPDRM